MVTIIGQIKWDYIFSIQKIYIRFCDDYRLDHEISPIIVSKSHIHDHLL